MSLFIEDNCVLINDVYYEKLDDHLETEGPQFRYFESLDADDYDYVESNMLEDVFHRVFEQVQEIYDIQHS